RAPMGRWTDASVGYHWKGPANVHRGAPNEIYMTSSFNQLVASTLLVVGALFPIVNPLGNAPIFLMLTRGISDQGRAKLARAIAVNGLVLMLVSLLIGTHILGFFGISLPVVQVSGGLVVAATGWSLLRHSDDDDAALDAKRPCTQTNYMRQA